MPDRFMVAGPVHWINSEPAAPHVSSLLSPARAALPHVWPAELQENHGQPGPVSAQVQPGSAVGGH